MIGRPHEPDEIVSERTKLFIKRERIRRELLKIKPGETICLQGETVETLLKWVKELEKDNKELEQENKNLKGRFTKYGIKEC